MTDTDRHDSPDLLDRSIAAIRRAQAPPGPDSKAAADTLAAVRQAAGLFQADAPNVKLFQKVVTMIYLHKKAVTLTVAAGGLAACVALLLVAAFPTASFAQVVEKLRNVHSMTCTERVTLPGNPQPMTVKMEYLGKKMRSEVGDSLIALTDQETGQAMVLDPKARTARIAKVEVTGGPKSPFEMDPIDEVRKLAGKKGDPIGQQQIGAVKAKGFRVTEDGRMFTVWVDPATELPVRIEITVEMGGAKMNVTLDDLAFDVPLDEKRFSLEPPAGYTVTRQELSLNMNVEENVVTVLRAMSAANGGKFPAQIDDPAAIAKLVRADDKGQPTPETMKIETASGALRGLLFKYEKGKTYDYLPDAKPGDPKAIVFWRRDADSKKIMGVFGDLTIHEITAEQVPPPSKSDVPPPPLPIEVPAR